MSPYALAAFPGRPDFPGSGAGHSGSSAPHLAPLAAGSIAPFRTIFLNLLQLPRPPWCFAPSFLRPVLPGTVLAVGSIGVKALVYYTITTAGAIVLALALASLFRGLFPVLDLESGGAYQPPEPGGPLDTLLNLFPSNIVAPFADAAMLQAIAAALLLGLCTLSAGAGPSRRGPGGERQRRLYAGHGIPGAPVPPARSP
ncbi:MAG: cation:dicarboxylase symporter family transporter [Dysosmobacter sp.]